VGRADTIHCRSNSRLALRMRDLRAMHCRDRFVKNDLINSDSRVIQRGPASACRGLRVNYYKSILGLDPDEEILDRDFAE